jgi:hypothetical protein
MPNSTQNIASLIQALNNWHKGKTAYDNALADKNAQSYNPLLILRLNENKHSLLLADLLDPQGLHRKGSLFLRHLIGLTTIQEDWISDDWQVTPNLNHVDIHLKDARANRVIIIENKCFGAIDQPNQLYRYWRDARQPDASGRIPEVHLIYLTTRDEHSPSQQSLTCPSDPELAAPEHDCVPKDSLHCIHLTRLTQKWVDEALTKFSDNESLRLQVTHYHHFWKSHMNTKETIAQLAAESFTNLEAWSTFSELRSLYDDITWEWLKHGHNKLRKSFEDRPSPGWECSQWENPGESRWHLNEFVKDSIGLGIGWMDQGFYLTWPTANKQQYEAALTSLNDQKEYASLKAVFNVSDKPYRISCGCLLGDEHYNPFTDDTSIPRVPSIAWHAQDEPEIFAARMGEKVREITDNPELTGLIRKLNEEMGLQAKLHD